MTEKFINNEALEQKQAMVSDWIKNISEKQEVREISSTDLREVLESYGAKFENLNEEEKESLRGYSEKERAKGARAVWGEKFDNYKIWAESFAEEYEIRTGIELPKLENKKNPEKSTHRKNSGMIQFLNDLTSFTSGEYSFETFKVYTEGRVKNGVAWAEGRKNERIRISVPTAAEPILLSSVPPEFPIKALEWLKKY